MRDNYTESNLLKDERIFEWVRYASQNKKTAERILNKSNYSNETLIQLYKASMEKYLKACLIFCNKDYPKKHDLFTLNKILSKDNPSFETLNNELLFMDNFQEETKYPSFHMRVTKEDAREVIKSFDICYNLICDNILKKYININNILEDFIDYTFDVFNNNIDWTCSEDRIYNELDNISIELINGFLENDYQSNKFLYNVIPSYYKENKLTSEEVVFDYLRDIIYDNIDTYKMLENNKILNKTNEDIEEEEE